METRKEILSTLKVCRFCLTTDETLIPLYNKTRTPKTSVPFALKILACIAIEIFPSDKMPQYICHRCKLFMELSYAFKQLCRQADEAILQYIQVGTPLAAMPWPTQLNKVHKAYNKSTDVNVVKTVVQGGATIKVMTEEISDSEEGEDDNVYNVKIGDGPETGKSIKIITSVEDKPESAGTKKGRQDSGDADTSAGAVTDGRCWACDLCECTYPLEQLLTLHKAQKHRVRTETCEECGGKFFSKYDLMNHQLTHVPDMAFQCVACDKKFKHLVLLKRHEKVMHSELPQHNCPKCPATFLSTEELEVHQQRHERHPAGRLRCYLCNKKFHFKSTLERHILLVHNKKQAYSCQYCPEQFPSVSKLTRHVREHAGERPYPCKHCDKSFMKSHHYTRHLRVKHSETIRTPGPYTESEAYRCEECEATFSSQDDLMYHSALHATTNLTCPLCQEKFDDVDTVTAHIKSHVSDAEHMCDFCELIFTSKEKLENHITCAHDDELLANEQDTENDESSMDMDAEEEDEYNSINVKEEDGHMVVEINDEREYLLPTAVQREEEDKTDNTQSEDSDVTNNDSPVAEMEAMPTPKKQMIVLKHAPVAKVPDIALKQVQMKPAPMENHGRINPMNILRKAEEIKRKVTAAQQQAQLTSAADKKEKVSRVESTTSSGASDKSLRLLEKELQDLKRTNTRVEIAKTPSRSVESLRNRRPQLYPSTPKIRPIERKEAIAVKPVPEKMVPDKRHMERKVAKDTKETKELKSNNNTIKADRELKLNVKEDKKENGKEDKQEKEKEDIKEIVQEDKKEIEKEDKKEMEKENKKDKENKREKEKEIAKDEKKVTVKEDKKEKETPKVIRNGATENPIPAVVEEPVRRSSRPTKFKDYAKMIRDSSMNSDDSGSEEESQEYKEPQKTPETRIRGRRSSNKQTPVATPVKSVTQATVSKQATVAKSIPPVMATKSTTPSSAEDSESSTPAEKPQTSATPKPAKPAPRKRGRPRKEQPQTVVPSKIKKDDPSEEDIEIESPKAVTPAPQISQPNEDAPKVNENDNTAEGIKTPETNKLPAEASPGVIISPSGQTLKKVPIKALPPGVKPLPLPVNSRLSGGEVCEMQIGKKMVKVQKIVMTKAEVEAMAKKGLVEMKDGTMVLKAGIKLPGADPVSLKSTLVGEGDNKKESPAKSERPAPTRCDLDP